MTIATFFLHPKFAKMVVVPGLLVATVLGPHVAKRWPKGLSQVEPNRGADLGDTYGPRSRSTTLYSEKKPSFNNVACTHIKFH